MLVSDVEELPVELLSAMEWKILNAAPASPYDQCERVFEPFYRLPGSSETNGGVGLGLSLVKQMAERHAGSVSCLPRDGGGTCFRFCFVG